MESELTHSSTAKPSSMRWKLLRRAIRRRDPPDQSEKSHLSKLSRRTSNGFNLIPRKLVKETGDSPRRDACFCYTLPIPDSREIFIRQRWEDCADLSDFEVCNRYDIDNTGLVCQWPSEDVLSYYSLSCVDSFRNKRVIELGSGYGLAGLVIAMVSEASEVVISDGNPQVVDYIQHNIDANSASFGRTKVMPMMLHWDQPVTSDICGTFDIIIASDCTFFKEYHKALAQTIRCLLKQDGPCEALLFSPRRGNSLDMFLAQVCDNDLQSTVTEMYDAEVWRLHQSFVNGDPSWPNYESDHCYPLLVRITR